MDLTVSTDDPTPTFEQLRRQIVQQVRAGDLRAGERLPPVRRLAEELGLAANTVARTYRELEHDGVVETRGRHGTFVAHPGGAAQRAAAAAAEEYAVRIERLGLDPEQALELAAAALGLTTAPESRA